MITVLFIASAASLAAAQWIGNDTTGQFTCAHPNQAYCILGSMQSNIILRCNDQAIGQPGNCNDNLAGNPPQGVAYSPCWQTSETSGDAACSKNCVVYGASGNHNGTFTLPPDQCTPSSVYTLTFKLPSASLSPSPVGPSTLTACVESETGSTGAVPASEPTTTATPAAPGTTTVSPPVSPPSSPDPGNSTASKTSGPGTGSGMAPTSTSSVTAASTTFATAGAVSKDIGFGLGLMGLLVGAML